MGFRCNLKRINLSLLFRFQIIEKSTYVELNLIKSEIEEIDAAIQTGINDLCWNSESKN